MYALLANLELLFMNILLVSTLFFFNLRYWKPKLLNPLSAIYTLVIIGSILEMVAFYADGKPELIHLNEWSNILYLSSIGIMSSCMLAYGSAQFPKPIWKSKIQHTIWMLPVLVEILLLVTSPKTKLIFYVAEDGFYHRASTFFLQLIPYGYLLITTFFGIYWFFKSETTKERNQYLAIAMFSVPPFFLGGTQLLIKENTLDILEFSISISLLADYAVSQNNRITRDTLTHLPNREVLDSVLMEHMKSSRREKQDPLYVMMCDLDSFKSINDNYGHPEGDQALIQAADVLYQVCNKHKAIAARIGGDEFAIVAEAGPGSAPETLIQEINEKLEQISNGKDYLLRMSIGYAFFRPSDTISDIMKAADRELYQVKKSRKSNMS